MILIDTNILARLPNAGDPQRDLAKASIIRAMREGRPLVISPQCLYEFYVIVTRPSAENGLGFSPHRAGRWLYRLRHMATLLPDDLRVCQRWEGLVTAHSTSGKKAHDAHLVAWMLVHQVKTVLTFNVRDFSRYGIEVLDPKAYH